MCIRIRRKCDSGLRAERDILPSHSTRAKPLANRYCRGSAGPSKVTWAFLDMWEGYTVPEARAGRVLGINITLDGGP
jgi:hypothetical protein